jgi:peptidoglycan/xylan/chitin deacetylase (PgdA/CDA1 family)
MITGWELRREPQGERRRVIDEERASPSEDGALRGGMPAPNADDDEGSKWPPDVPMKGPRLLERPSRGRLSAGRPVALRACPATGWNRPRGAQESPHRSTGDMMSVADQCAYSPLYLRPRLDLSVDIPEGCGMRQHHEPAMTRRRWIRYVGAVVGTTILIPPAYWYLGRREATGSPDPTAPRPVGGDGWTISSGIARPIVGPPSATAGVSVRLQTLGTGRTLSLRSPRFAPVDLTRRMIRVSFRIVRTTADRLAGVGLVVGSGAEAFDAYGRAALADYGNSNRATEWVKPDEWVGLTLTPPSFADRAGHVDWHHIRDLELVMWDQGRGHAEIEFGGFDVVPTSATRRAVVSFTFDDGYLGVVARARPVLARHGFVGTAYVIRDLITPGESGTYMSPADLDVLQRTGWEVACHADRVAVHNTPGGLPALPLRTVRRDWDHERRAFRLRGLRGWRDFAYPQGEFDLRLLRIARHEWDAAATVYGRTIETNPPADRYRLRRTFCYPTSQFGPPSQPSSIEWLIDQVDQYGGWLILGFHDISHAGTLPESDAVDVRHLTRIADDVARRGLTVMTVGEVLQQK